MGISLSTLCEWQNKYPEISESIKRGKAPVDIQVENALLKKALGYTYYEETTEIIQKDGKEVSRHIRRVKKEAPPDTLAQIYWLKNRKPTQWRDKREVEEIAPADDPLIEMIKRWDDAARK